MKRNLEILKEDHDIVVCRKPAGIPVQSAKAGRQDLVSLLKNHRARQNEAPEIYVVHRLDQPVEGVMVFAKNKKAAASLSRQIQQKGVEKYYYAMVEGTLEPEQGELVDYLIRDGRTNTSRVAKRGTKGAKKAELSYQTLASGDGKSLVKICLKTGRHHQIRVQMAHAGHPLLGDKKYNPNCKEGYLPVGLCAVELVFQHPATGREMSFSIEPEGPLFLSRESD